MGAFFARLLRPVQILATHHRDDLNSSLCAITRHDAPPSIARNPAGKILSSNISRLSFFQKKRKSIYHFL